MESKYKQSNAARNIKFYDNLVNSFYDINGTQQIIENDEYTISEDGRVITLPLKNTENTFLMEMIGEIEGLIIDIIVDQMDCLPGESLSYMYTLA